MAFNNLNLRLRTFTIETYNGRERWLLGEVQKSVSQLHGGRMEADNSGVVSSNLTKLFSLKFFSYMLLDCNT